MTLTELSAKHNIDHDKAVAFLRDWLDAQKPIAWYMMDGKKPFIRRYKWGDRRFSPLIARPELGDL